LGNLVFKLQHISCPASGQPVYALIVANNIFQQWKKEGVDGIFCKRTDKFFFMFSAWIFWHAIVVELLHYQNRLVCLYEQEV
jgi:hypothetical protein